MSARFFACVVVVSVLLASVCYARDQVWLIGGGYDLESSQAQIEKNVLWAERVIRSAPGRRDISIFFTDGEAPEKDVLEWAPVANRAETLQPLARVYNSYISNGERYRNHRVGAVTGSTRPEVLRNGISATFSALEPGDRALLVFNGHGTHEPDDPAENRIHLWGGASFSVRELYDLLSRIDPNVSTRFVLTQCYSGGFARLVHPQAGDVLELDEAERCGFMAEAADRPAEGCSSGIDTGDYRDYSTYFFAALHGETREGKALPVDPDRDGDGAVTLFEAHLYALEAGQSSDVPRATSEVFLERWQPWYLRWFSWGTPGENRYRQLTRALAVANELPTDPDALERAIERRRKENQKTQSELRTRRKRLRDAIGEVRWRIRRAVERRWPEAGYAYTRNFRDFLLEDLVEAQAFIQSHEAYPELVRRQTEYARLGAELLEAERAAAQLAKIRRMRRLGRILDQLKRHASGADRAAYERLRACEDRPL